MTRHLLAATVLALVAPLAACSPGGDAPTVRVLAAASLTDAFTDLAEDFEAAHPDVEVELSFASSTSLAEQAADGAPGDVLATADPAAMRVATDADAAGEPTRFATNVVVIATAPGNPAGITDLSSLAGTTWVRCADQAPCGRASRELLDAAGVDAEPASLEEDVRATLEKVTSGEADAGLVYATDARAASDAVTAVEVPDADTVANDYLVAPLAQSEHPDLAEDFVELVTGPEGQRVLGEAGFRSP
ncbi:molybdate ABC transporter substrate-binding protein [Nocardioides panacisoli]|uniref:molybdate ABC transporter substrate-binding protein n=1 Tax=Nocardioides panacisoli TaxID=627624 RepID=UPI001C62C6D0|nr:molybdate ABC transporter substrate-binding protein [Nocardioides panacisoli]QYJ02603.1 molybdate ABC transporter substrate-binding protein [Nocardioides panacisoli]